MQLRVSRNVFPKVPLHHHPAFVFDSLQEFFGFGEVGDLVGRVLLVHLQKVLYFDGEFVEAAITERFKTIDDVLGLDFGMGV